MMRRELALLIAIATGLAGCGENRPSDGQLSEPPKARAHVKKVSESVRDTIVGYSEYLHPPLPEIHYRNVMDIWRGYRYESLDISPEGVITVGQERTGLQSYSTSIPSTAVLKPAAIARLKALLVGWEILNGSYGPSDKHYSYSCMIRVGSHEVTVRSEEDGQGPEAFEKLRKELDSLIIEVFDWTEKSNEFRVSEEYSG